MSDEPLDAGPALAQARIVIMPNEAQMLDGKRVVPIVVQPAAPPARARRAAAFSREIERADEGRDG